MATFKTIKKRIGWMLLFVLLLSLLLVQQYQQYKTLPHLNLKQYAYTIPVNNTDDHSINWRYFAVLYDNLDTTKSVDRQFTVSVSPSFEHSVYYASQGDLYLKVIDKYEQEFKNNTSTSTYNLLRQIYEGDNKNLVIERIGGSFKPNTKYTITIQLKPFNIFSLLNGSQTLRYTFTTSADTTDEYESRKNKIFSALGSYVASIPTKEQLEKQKRARKICQLSILQDYYANKGKGDLQHTPIDGKYYEIEELNCLPDNFTGETVTIKLLDPRGKAEFEQFLKDNNVNLQLLKITYKQ